MSTPSNKSKSKSKSKSKAPATATATATAPTLKPQTQQQRQGQPGRQQQQHHQWQQQQLLHLHRQQSASPKLRPIYAALDSRNYTRAVKLSQHKSLSDWPIVCALRAHCLTRIGGRDDEARASLAEVLGYPIRSDYERDGGEEMDVAELLDVPLHADYVPGASSSPAAHSASNEDRPPPGPPLDETTLSTVAVTLRSMNAHRCLVRMYGDASSFASSRLSAAAGGTAGAGGGMMSAEEAAVTGEELASALRGLFSAHLRAALRLPDVAVEGVGDGGGGDEEWDWMALDVVEYQKTAMDRLGLYPRPRRRGSLVGDGVPSSPPAAASTPPDPTRHYEAMQTASMALARASSSSGGDGGHNPYWTWAVFSILLHHESIGRHSGNCRDAEERRRMEQKAAMLPRLAEGLCRSKIVDVGKGGGRGPSGEDWKLYLRTLLLQGKYGEAIDVLRDRVPTSSGSGGGNNKDAAPVVINDEDDVRNASGSVLQMTDRDRDELLAAIHFANGDYDACREMHESMLLRGTGRDGDSGGVRGGDDDDEGGGEPSHQWSSLLRMVGSSWYGASLAIDGDEKEGGGDGRSERRPQSLSSRQVESLRRCEEFVTQRLLPPTPSPTEEREQGASNSDGDVVDRRAAAEKRRLIPLRGAELALLEIAAIPVRWHLGAPERERGMRDGEKSMREVGSPPLPDVSSLSLADDGAGRGGDGVEKDAPPYGRGLLDDVIRLRGRVCGYVAKFSPHATCAYRDVRPYVALWSGAVRRLLVLSASADDGAMVEGDDELRPAVVEEVRHMMAFLRDLTVDSGASSCGFNAPVANGEQQAGAATGDVNVNVTSPPLSASEKKRRLRRYTTACTMALEIEYMLLLRPPPSPSTLSGGELEVEDVALRAVMGESVPKLGDMLAMWTSSLRWSSSSAKEKEKEKDKQGRGDDGAGGGSQKEGLPGDDLILLTCATIVRCALSVPSSARIPSVRSSEEEEEEEEEADIDADSAATGAYARVLSLLTAASLLERAVTLSPHNAPLKVFLIQIYGLLNAGRRAHELFTQLNVKQIQIESLSYLILEVCVRSGLYSEASRQCMDVLKLHRVSFGDVPQYVGDSLGNGNVGVALDMMRFQGRQMNRSLQLLHAQGLIMDLAPLAGVEDHAGKTQQQQQQHQRQWPQERRKQQQQQQHHNKKTSGNGRHGIGFMNGLTGSSELHQDVDRATQMVRDAADPFSSPSIMRLAIATVDGASSESTEEGHVDADISPPSLQSLATAFSDNRDFSVCDFDVVAAPSYRGDNDAASDVSVSANNVIARKEAVVMESIERGILHKLLVHAVFSAALVRVLPKKKKGQQKGGVTRQQHRDDESGKRLRRRCHLLLSALERAEQHLATKTKSWGTEVSSSQSPAGGDGTCVTVAARIESIAAAELWRVAMGLCRAIASLCVKFPTLSKDESDKNDGSDAETFTLIVAETDRVSNLRATLLLLARESNVFSFAKVFSAGEDVTEEANPTKLIDPSILSMVGTLVPGRLVAIMCLMGSLQNVFSQLGSGRKGNNKAESGSNNASNSESAEALQGLSTTLAGLVDDLHKMISLGSCKSQSGCEDPWIKSQQDNPISFVLESSFPGCGVSDDDHICGEDLFKDCVHTVFESQTHSLQRIEPLLTEMSEVLSSYSR